MMERQFFGEPYNEYGTIMVWKKGRLKGGNKKKYGF